MYKLGSGRRKEEGSSNDFCMKGNETEESEHRQEVSPLREGLLSFPVTVTNCSEESDFKKTGLTLAHSSWEA